MQISEFTSNYSDIVIEADFILIVEKETVFFKLVNEQNTELLKSSVIVTGKGYPDYATKKFLKLLNYKYPTLPIFFLGDSDPFGFDILCKYCFSTPLTMFEYDNLPSIAWLGTFYEDF